jgi:hypothetical protein
MNDATSRAINRLAGRFVVRGVEDAHLVILVEDTVSFRETSLREFRRKRKEVEAQPKSDYTGRRIRERNRKQPDMDLQDFVATTLCQISAGVAIAKNYDRCVAPRVGIGDSDPKILRTLAEADGVFLVEFDVVVTTSDATENGAPANITVLSMPPANGKAKRSIENSPVNRVKFSVPISYR